MNEHDFITRFLFMKEKTHFLMKRDVEGVDKDGGGV